MGMVKLKCWPIGFIGQMETHEFETREQAEQYLEGNKETINVVTATITEE